MTTYLQPGDKIHLAFGIAEGMPDELAKRKAAEGHEGFMEMYAAMRVIVVGTTAIPGLKEPVIVSVVREPKTFEVPKPPRSLKPVDETPMERPRAHWDLLAPKDLLQ